MTLTTAALQKATKKSGQAEHRSNRQHSAATRRTTATTTTIGGGRPATGSARRRRGAKVNRIDYLYRSDVDLGSRPTANVVGEFSGHTILIREMLQQSTQAIRAHNLPPVQRAKFEAELPTPGTQKLLQGAFKAWSIKVVRTYVPAVSLSNLSTRWCIDWLVGCLVGACQFEHLCVVGVRMYR